MLSLFGWLVIFIGFPLLVVMAIPFVIWWIGTTFFYWDPGDYVKPLLIFAGIVIAFLWIGTKLSWW